VTRAARRWTGRWAAGVAVAVSLGCGLPDTEYFGAVGDVRDARHLRFCNAGEPEGLDPATVSSTIAMKPVYQLFDGLADFGADGLPEPSLATRWEQSGDLRTFTFHLHDRGRFSNGRPITAHDVRYQLIRVLHPSTASVNAFLAAEVKNATQYNGNAVRLVLRDTGGLRAGDVVEVEAVDDVPLAAWRKQLRRPWPDSNERRGSAPLALRDLGAGARDAYATVPVGAPVTVIELTGDPLRPTGDTWAYVYWNRGDGAYGWVPWAELDGAPHADARYRVRRVPPRRRPGVALTASEIVIADPPGDVVEVRAADLLMVPEVLGVRVPDDHTIVFETENPTPWFPSLSPSRAFRPTPREAVSRWPRRWTDVGRIVTSGPMHLVGWHQRDRIELVRSPTFWNQDEVKLDRLTIYAIDDQAASTNLYFTGRCDAVTTNHIPASYTAALKRYKDFHLDPWLGIYFVQFQTEKFPDRHLRRALALAVDRAVFPEILDGEQVPSAQYTPGTPIAQLTDAELAVCGVGRDHPGVALIMIPGELCYVPPPGLDFDPDRARRELQLARDRAGDSRYPGTIVYKLNHTEHNKLVAEYLQQQWRDVLGIDVQLQVQEWKTYLADTRNGDFEIGRLGWIGNFPDAEGEFLPIFRCGSPNNRARYCGDAFEAALAAARPITDRQARLAKVRDAEQHLVDDAPMIPLFVYTQAHLVKPYVRDFHINSIDQVPLHQAWLDPDWRAR
jgi:oligopeptide transport system substrate-binding protein